MKVIKFKNKDKSILKKPIYTKKGINYLAVKYIEPVLGREGMTRLYFLDGSALIIKGKAKDIYTKMRQYIKECHS